MDRSKLTSEPGINAAYVSNALPHTSTEYRYAVLTQPYVEEVAQLFTETFCTAEPMTEYLHMDQEKYMTFARAVSQQAANDGISVIALHHDKVIACALAEDIVDAENITANFDSKFHFILGLLGQLGEHFFTGKTFMRNNIAHLFITAVKKDYRRQGLSTQINYRAMDLAAKAGYDCIYCEFTNQYCEFGTMHHLRMPRKLIGECNYQQFTLENCHPFAALQGSAKSYLWALHPQAVLKYKKHNQYSEEAIFDDLENNANL